MRTEIGGEFWNVLEVNNVSKIIPKGISWYQSGRSALLAIIEDIKKQRIFHEVALPSWCCDSMISPFLKNGIEVKFYPVYIVNGRLIHDSSSVDSEVVLVLDYFGYTGQIDAKRCESIVIRDMTHSIFSSIYNDADYYFGSLRKWTGFWTGGYAWGVQQQKELKTDDKYAELRKAAMEEKAKYISSASDSKEYLKTFEKAEEYLENCRVAAADPRDVKLAMQLNVETIKAQRHNNAKCLLEAFADIAIFPTFKDTDCPMFVPILVPYGKRNKLRQYLIEREIYNPIHWQVSQYHRLTNQTQKIFDEELSLVCDQRYTENDMDRIISTIKEFWKGV